MHMSFNNLYLPIERKKALMNTSYVLEVMMPKNEILIALGDRTADTGIVGNQLQIPNFLNLL